jgi:hypothetical protein
MTALPALHILPSRRVTPCPRSRLRPGHQHHTHQPLPPPATPHGRGRDRRRHQRAAAASRRQRFGGPDGEPDRRTGLPDLDPLIDVAEAERPGSTGHTPTNVTFSATSARFVRGRGTASSSCGGSVDQITAAQCLLKVSKARVNSLS